MFKNVLILSQKHHFILKQTAFKACHNFRTWDRCKTEKKNYSILTKSPRNAGMKFYQLNTKGAVNYGVNFITEIGGNACKLNAT